MSVISKIENKAVKYAKSGLKCPDFVFVSCDIYSDLLKEMTYHSTPQPLGHTYLSIWTSVACLKIKVCSSWPDDSIIIGDHPVLTILQKLGDII